MISSILIFSIWRLREVACRAFEAFAEKRRPTQAELVAAAPDNPVYIQLFYANVLLTPAGLKTLNINDEADLGAGGKFERDAAGNPTGWISGSSAVITRLFDKLPVPTFAQYGMPEFEKIQSLNVLLGPAGLPEPVLKRLSDALARVLPTAEMAAALKPLRDHPLYMSPAQTTARMRADYERYDQVIKAAGIQLNP